MNKNELKFIAENLIETFNEAGKESIDLFAKGLKIEIKEDNSPVSNGDLKVNELICKKIKADLPIGEVGFFHSYISNILKWVFLQKLLNPRNNALVSVFHNIVPGILNMVNFGLWKNTLPPFQKMVIEHKIFSTPGDHYRK